MELILQTGRMKFPRYAFKRFLSSWRHSISATNIIFCNLKGGHGIPFINIRVLKGTLSDEKKSEMIKRVCETVAEIEASPEPKDNLVPYTWCVIEDVDFGAWCRSADYLVLKRGAIFRID